MRSIGHEELTREAINQLSGMCIPYKRVCAGIHEKVGKNRVEEYYLPVSIADSDLQNKLVNNAAVLYTKINLPKTVHSLSIYVLGMDFGPNFWTHTANQGQRYHFMKVSGQTDQEAYSAAIEFVSTNFHEWVKLTAKAISNFDHSMKNKKCLSAITNQFQNEIDTAKKALGAAIHCLQDSFSPGHVIRSKMPLTQQELRSNEIMYCTDLGDRSSPAPIRKLFDYQFQSHNPNSGAHAIGDESSGVANSAWGKLAVAATVEMLSLGISMILKKSKGQSWIGLCQVWLKSEFTQHREVRTRKDVLAL